MNSNRVKSGIELTNYTGNLSVKTLNRVAVLRTLILGGPVSRLDIAAQTGLSTATVSRVVNSLIDEGLVEEVGASLTGSRGCPPIVLQFRGNVAYVIGVDIGESYIKYELVNLLGETIDAFQVTTDALIGNEVTFERLVAGLNRIMNSNSLEEKDVWCVCVSVPGIVDDKGYVNIPEIVGWWHYPLYDKLCRVIKTKIILENTNKCAVLGEYLYGCAKDADSAVLMKIGVGFGGAIILNGKLLMGNHSASGEFGFMMAKPDCEPLRSRKRGALEDIVGLYPMMKDLNESVAGAVDENNIPHMLTICQEAADGNEEYMQIIKRNAVYYAQAAVNVAAVIDPEVMIIGGDISPVADIIIRYVEEYMKEFLPYVPKVLVAELGSNASLKGATRIALESSLVRFGVFTPDDVVGEY